MTLNCSTLGGPDNTYQWQRNGTDLDNETMQSITITHISAPLLAWQLMILKSFIHLLSRIQQLPNRYGV